MSDLNLNKEWLIRKRGYYYRPNRAGYTSSVLEAGRYTEQEAKDEAKIEPGKITAVHFSEVDSRYGRVIDEFDAVNEMVKIMAPREYEDYLRNEITNGDYFTLIEALDYARKLVAAGYQLREK